MALNHIPFYASLLGRLLGPGGIKAANQGHVLVYGAIEAHNMGSKGCIASNKTIATETGLSIGRVANLISELNKAGWISVKLDEETNQRLGIKPMMTLHAGVNPPSRESEPPLHAGVNIEDNKENSKKSSTKVAEPVKDEELFFNLVAKLGYSRGRVKFTPGRKQKLAARLRSYGEEEIQKAAHALTLSPWHMGENPNGVKYATIDFLIRNDETVEKWSQHKIVNPARAGGVTKI